MIVQRGYRKPTSFHSPDFRARPVGYYFDVMTNGFGVMPSYAPQVRPADRWAIAAWIRVLQLSQNATLEDVPPSFRDRLMGGEDLVIESAADEEATEEDHDESDVEVGVASLAIAAVAGVQSPDQFFRSYLVGFLFWFGVSIGSLAVLMLQFMSGGAWGVVMRRPLEAGAATIPLMAVLFVPILFGLHSIYEWTHEEVVASDPLLQHKASYLNVEFFTARAVLFFAIWIALGYFLDRWERTWAESGNPWYSLRVRRVSAGGLVMVGLTLTFASVDWMMSLEPHWFSTMYGISFIVGNMLSGFAFCALVVIILSTEEPMSKVAASSNFRDFGNLQLAFVMLWAYTAFSQYLLIWYGNLIEEIPYYITRMRGGWGATAAILIVFHFFIPFVVLLMRNVKDRARALGVVALLILVMRLVDLHWLISPAFEGGAFHNDWRIPLIVVGLGGPWFYVFVRRLRQQPPVPMYEDYVRDALQEDEALSHG